jgi:tRNA dimethylallyltransferase
VIEAPTVSELLTAILGPTASGKSALALHLAETSGGEIVAADALMVYRDFDIGTNKPDAQERARIPHHMLDVHRWDEPMHAGAYAALASRVVDDILARGKRPIVVVGTYLYYRALVYGLLEVPASEPHVRQALLDEEQRDPGFLAREVARIDPKSFAEAGGGKNLPRLVRALEIHRTTGQQASALREAHGFKAPRYDVEVIGLAPSKEALNARIEGRAALMLERGWIEEVQALLASGVSPEARPMQAVGYREIALALASGTVDRRTLAQSITVQTRQYARRQRSFFKQEPNVRWVQGFGESERD